MAHQSKKKRTDEDTVSSDAGQKPIQLQRRRVWRACESCRRKKIKCDGCEPTCAQCSASGSQCTWLQTKDRAALSRHYVQELEARLLHMESIFSQLAPVLEQMGSSPHGAAIADILASPAAPVGDISTPAPPALRPIAPKTRTTSEPSTPIKIEDDFSDSFGQLALDEYGHMRWIGGSSTMSLIQSFRSLTSLPLHRISPMEEDPLAPGPSANKLYFPASVFFGKLHALPGPEEVEYPERDLADKLVDAYFSRLHFLMPVIDKPSFLRQYNNIMDNTHDTRIARSETAFLSLMFSVFACAANLVQDSRLTTGERRDDGGMGMLYYERALILQYISHASIQTSHVQCFVLLSSFLCSVNCLPQAWILLGQAVRTGQDLGLHRSPRRLVLTPIEKETRRKIWWGVYTLDRMLAVALGRPLGINDSDCDVELPVEVDDDTLLEYFTGEKQLKHPTLMTGFLLLIKLYQIAGRVLKDVYALDVCKDTLDQEQRVDLQATVQSLDAQLNEWCDNLPPQFKAQSENNEQVSMGAVLCSHYYSVLTTLHRNLLPVKQDQLVTPKSTAKAVSSARSSIRLAPSMRDVVPPSHHLAFFIQHLFSSAVILLLYAMHSPDTRAANVAMEEAKSTLTALQSWEGLWPGARKCKELLIELTNTASEAIAKNAASEKNMQAPPTASPALLERRRSVTIATTGLNSVPGRALKGKPRRNQSREAGSSSRRLAAVSPYRVDTAHRARSSSRKRGHDESETGDGGLSPYYQSFSPTSTRPNANSAHSSPASVNLPSPAGHGNDRQGEPSPTLASATTFPYSSSGMSPIHIPSPRYDYDYGMQTSVGQPDPNQWSNGAERQGLDMYPSPSHDGLAYGSPYGTYGSPLDTMYPSYEPAADINGGGLAGLSSTPPTASFAAPGLPFRGYEFIKNYNAGGYSMGDQDSLWQSYDPGAFEYNPEIPFTLGDSDIHDSHR